MVVQMRERMSHAQLQATCIGAASPLPWRFGPALNFAAAGALWFGVGRSARSLVRANQARPDNPLNVDVTPTNIRDMKVLTKLAIEYTPQRPAVAPGSVQAPMLYVRQNVSVWLESGKPMVISESADPLSDRRLTVEVTATILK